MVRNTAPGIPLWRMMLCGAPISSSRVKCDRRMNTSLASSMTPRASVVEKKTSSGRTSCSGNGQGMSSGEFRSTGLVQFSSSADWLHTSYTDEETNLYEYNLITKKVNKVLTYSGQGLPIIKENEIIYSKDNKIYLFNRLTNKSEYLFDGKLPFNYADGEIFYVKNGKIMKNKKNR